MTGKGKRPATLEEAIAARFAPKPTGKAQESVSVEEAVASAFAKAMKNLETS